MTKQDECREALIKKCLYAFERELGNRLGFDPVKQGDDFIAAMTKAIEEYESRRPTPEPVSLEACAAAVKSFRDPAGHDSKRIAKAVLTAAGVPFNE